MNEPELTNRAILTEAWNTMPTAMQRTVTTAPTIPQIAVYAGAEDLSVGDGVALVAAAISLEKGQRFVATWLRSCLWTVAPLLSGLPFALALMAAMEASLVWVVLLTLPFSSLLVGFYRGHAAARPNSLLTPAGHGRRSEPSGSP